MRAFASAGITLTLATACWVAASASPRAGAQTPGDATVPSGSSLYTSSCASCHGTSGRGDGPVSEHLRRPPADLTRLTMQSGGTFPADRLMRIIDGRQAVRGHGTSDMPVWGDALSTSLIGGDEETVRSRIRAIVKHLESIQQRRSD